VVSGKEGSLLPETQNSKLGTQNLNMTDKFILLCEDNEDDVELTQLAFRKNGTSAKLVVVWNGEEALDFLFGKGQYADRDINQIPALVLLDLKLPYVSGLDILKKIRADKRISQIPVVILTSSVEDKDRTDSFRLGANDFIIKPMGYAQFIEIIQQIKSKWLA
jgi:two-component system, response regulator